MYDNANIYNANKIFIEAGEFYGPPYGMSCTGINEIYLLNSGQKRLTGTFGFP